MAWRVARSLLTLREQIDQAFPNRDKASDGTIGDADHRSRESDHNPWCGDDVVTALDITHDPDHGVDIDQLTDELQASRDPRIKYVIANGWIMSGDPGPSPWVWRDYDGTNQHTRHFHLSVICGAGMDDTRPWQLPSLQEDDMPSAKEIAVAVRAELLNRDIIDRPGEHPDNETFKVRHSLEGIWRQATAAHAVAQQNRAALRAMAESLPDNVRQAVHDALAENVTVEGDIDVTIGGGDQA